jgi:hypothetical protein
MVAIPNRVIFKFFLTNCESQFPNTFEVEVVFGIPNVQNTRLQTT